MTIKNESQITRNKRELSESVRSELDQRAINDVRSLKFKKEQGNGGEERPRKRQRKQKMKRPGSKKSRGNEGVNENMSRIRNLELLAAKFNQGFEGPRIAKHSQY